MAQNDTGNVEYQRGQELKITKRTVSFKNNIYQFKNIAGFSAGEIKESAPISWGYILIGFIIGFVSIGPFRLIEFGIFILAACAVGIMINLSQNKEYGLILTLNSGDRHMFVTSDHKTLSEVIQQLYTFMESDKDGTYIYTINDNSIQIQGNMTGGVAAVGNRSSTINSNT